MADKKISELPAAGSAGDGDELAANQAGTTRKVTVSQVKAGLAPVSHTHAAGDINSGVLTHERGGLETDVSAFDGLIKIAGGATGNIKCNFAGNSAPTVNDDSSAGYSVGSRWYDLTADKEYVCLDAAATAAVWKETSQVNGAALASFAAYLGTNQSIAYNVVTALNIDTEESDTGGYFDTATYRWTPPAGRILVGGTVRITGMSLNKNMRAILFKNGAAIKHGPIVPESGIAAASSSVAAILDANGTDYFQLAAHHNESAGSRNAASGSLATFFWGTHLG